MTALFPLLAAYYICDVAAMQGALPPSEIARCSGVYEEVKLSFLTDAERAHLDDRHRAADMRRTAYRRFVAWERDNGEAVAQFRTEARILVSHLKALEHATLEDALSLEPVSDARVTPRRRPLR